MFIVTTSRTSLPVDTRHSPHARWRGLPLEHVALADGFWATRQAVNRRASLPHGFRMLEQAGNLENLRLAAERPSGGFRGPVFMDSDVYKWLEAAAYVAPVGLDADLRRQADTAIGLVQSAQAEDGYLDSYYQVMAPDRRWVELNAGHELYCAGHLIQAAVAWHRFAGDRRLLDVARRLVDHIATVFGPDRRPGTPGHPEIETALVELYRDTGERRYLELARFFVDQRGYGRLGPNPRFGGSAYYQDRVPVRQATEIEGHAVRALYLATGVADLYLETGERALLEAMLRQWQDMVAHKLYLTGGVGSRHNGEAFGHAYELPTERAYCETCAAIASIMWNWRLLLATGEGRFADLIERTLYNGFLSGVSLDGLRFFYVNPLLSRGQPEVVGRGGIRRQEWFPVACCPPNVMRLLATLGHYVASHDSGGVQVHQYVPATITAELEPGRTVGLRIETDYPWGGTVRLGVERTGEAAWALALRAPAWCASPAVRLNGVAVAATPGPDGYVRLERAWRAGDRVELVVPIEPRFTAPHPRIESTRAAVAIERGPVVYCLEQCDQPTVDVRDAWVDTQAPLSEMWRPDLLGGVVTVGARGGGLDVSPWAAATFGSPNIPCQPTAPISLTAIPYFAWANREPSAMRVWIPYLVARDRAVGPGQATD
jgi:uncharacterized protein